jgi:hypothetical protein
MSSIPFPLGGGRISTRGMELPIGVHEDGEKEARITLQQSKALFVLDSRNRYQNASSSLTPTTVFSSQPWNSFTLQKPAALMGAFAKRITVSEVNFPWYIPNITEYNNTFWINRDDSDEIFKISIVPGFYTPAEIVSAVNDEMAAVFADPPPILVYDPLRSEYSFEAVKAATTVAIIPNNPDNEPYNAQEYYNTRPSMLFTLGFQYDQLFLNTVNLIVGAPTASLYTDYVDICSSKLMTFSDIRDGNSSNNGKDSIVCRIYCADESSGTLTAPIGCRPFRIHRQFVNPKIVQWNPDSFIDWLDIQVFDMYGQLVWLSKYADQSLIARTAPYPAFQITCLASES